MNTSQSHEPWNKGKLIGQKSPLKLKDIWAIRAERGWSQEFLAFETGLHRTFITHCEGGSRNISIDNIEKIAIAFDVPISELFLRHRTK